MPNFPDFWIYTSGAFAGICVLVVLLGLIIGHAYDEHMLWWHSAAIAGALGAHLLGQDYPASASAMWAVQLALATMALCVATGSTGAIARPAKAMQYLAMVFIAVMVPAQAFGLLNQRQMGLLAIPWALLASWYLIRAWSQSGPWIVWIAAGQVALVVQHLLRTAHLNSTWTEQLQAQGLAALAFYAAATYLGMVWLSRLSAENALRVEARERTDPLTGLAMPRVFFDRMDGALIRSRSMGYTCAVLLARADNIEQIVRDRGMDNNEAVLLAASRAIAGSLRSQDSAARLSGNRFAIMAEGIAEGTANQIATRILANGLRAGEWGLKGSELQFQIAIVEIDPCDVGSATILAQLEEMLRDMVTGVVNNRIRVLPRISDRQVPGATPLAQVQNGLF
ncbi:MAG: GGDEF domain-containing protein [Polaromonas sp.]|uniref:GGDEF domain-containing protein n=1 Tax=Polaromonas sp. TaxID=1869339 RepID=UPI0025DC24B4|nr:GGDEF domain-containing protein [Polaromonas sp.]MBI2724891.1 GGDEF domain-containing protein [Polaromonas sp.]